MTNEYRKYAGVEYWLSASSQADFIWLGEANVRIKQGDEFNEKVVRTVESFRTDGEAMVAAEEQLKALCLSGALRHLMPGAYF
ncbi:hypothetical protein ACTACU_11540 [Pseudomonas syringae]|uniref:hypothetical protein n=1 Tax=Pseudomonas syringae TaxID=317 RepID=UPI003F873527